MSRPISSPRMVRARSRQAEATLLRASGWTYTAIARFLGYSCRASAFKAVNGLLAATQAQAALVYRVMGRLRVERGVESFANAVESGNFDQAMRTLDRILPESR